MAGAGILLGVAIGLLGRFFATRDERYDRAAEWCFVLFAILAVPAIVVFGGRLPGAGLIGTVATIAGAAGAAIVGLGELGSALRVVDFRRIAGAVTLGFLAFLAWIGIASGFIVAGNEFPPLLGWLGVASIVVAGAIVVWMARLPGVMAGAREPPRPAMAAFFVPLVGIVLWMVWLGWAWLGALS